MHKRPLLGPREPFSARAVTLDTRAVEVSALVQTVEEDGQVVY